jgi:hypothetical protein
VRPLSASSETPGTLTRDSITPGATAFTLIPSGPKLIAAARVMELATAFVPDSAASVGSLNEEPPQMLVMFTIARSPST